MALSLTVPPERFTAVFQEKLIRFLFKCQIIQSVIVDALFSVEANLWKEVSSLICFNSPLRWNRRSWCVCVCLCEGMSEKNNESTLRSVCLYIYVCVRVCGCPCALLLLSPSLSVTLRPMRGQRLTSSHTQQHTAISKPPRMLNSIKNA